MSTALHRRDILRAGLAGAAALSAPRFALAQGQAQSQAELSAEKLRGGLIAVRGAGATVLAAPDADGVVMVDGGLKARSAELLDFISAQAEGAPVRALINTHWHDEQTGSNQALGEAGTPIIAHENTRLWLAHENWVRWEDKTYAPLPKAAQPTQTVYDRGELPFGDGAAEYVYAPRAHTDGDLFVMFPQANVVATGGIGPADGWPVIDWSTGGWLGGYADALGQIAEAIDDDAIVVPANGPVLTKADLLEQQEMYSTILSRLAVSLRSSHGFKEMLAEDPTAGFRPEWGDPEFFLRQAYRGIWGYIRGDRRVSTI